MQKFNDLPYSRPSKGESKKLIQTSKKMLKNAKTPEETHAAYLKLSEAIVEPYTAQTLAHIRSTLNTKDAFYAKESRSANLNLAMVMKQVAGVMKLVFTSPLRKDIEEKFGAQTLRYREAMLKNSGMSTLLLSMKEGSLVAKQRKLAASCSVEFAGNTCSYYDLLKLMQSEDREVRRGAFDALESFCEKAAPEMDKIYDELLKVRIKKAKKLGYQSYIDYAYASKMRFDYSPEDTAKFREQIHKHIVPIYKEIAEAQRKRLDVEKLMFYDEPVYYKDGNPKLTGGTEQVIAAMGKAFDEMSPETGEFFRFLKEYELFDLEARPDKQLGGYALLLLKHKAPFIMSNFNGTSDDVLVMTHEGGHAFQVYYSSRRQELLEYIVSTSEINEIHAMSMELLAYPWMEEFFGSDADKYRAMHLARRLYSILYHMCVDEFQEEIYKDPGMTAEQRRLLWKKVEKKYVPWCDYGGSGHFESGASWMLHQHIFLSPFYIIEYSLAQICAYQYYLRSLEDRDSAWADYLRLCAAGGSKGYFELLQEGNLKNPFDDGVVEEVANAVKALIHKEDSHAKLV